MMSHYFKYTLLIIAIFTFSFECDAQVQDVLDGAYVREMQYEKRVIPYPHLREADVMYSKRLWQEMDLKQKINHPFFYPIEPIQNRQSLFDVIKEGLLGEINGDPSLVAYSAGVDGTEDEFYRENILSVEDVRKLLNPEKSIRQEDPETGEEIEAKMEVFPILSNQIVRYRLKEDWIWDRQRSERYVRIIGIAPIYEERREGKFFGYRPLFWLYYEECRPVFARAEAFNLFNDAQRRTFEDLFQKRYFSSYIVEESNVYDRASVTYVKGMDALAESERIKEELFLLEHDLWHY
jgi:gliding motility associated protien GldN